MEACIQPLEQAQSPLLPVSFLVLLLLVLLAILVGLRGQGPHGISNSFIVGIHAWKVLQDTLKELGVLHHVIIILLLKKGSVSLGQGLGQLGSALLPEPLSTCLWVAPPLAQCRKDNGGEYPVPADGTNSYIRA